VSAVEAAPPPPGSVVWSMLSWGELLRDGPWLEARWAPVAGSVVDDRPLPDARSAVLQGTGGTASAMTPVAAAHGTAKEEAGRYVPLGLFVIR